MSDERNVIRIESGVRRVPRPSGKVYLIGAGPGDPDLLTLKAVRALAACDAVLYDDLVNPAVLLHARCGAELLPAGRRAGARGTPQAEVTRLLIERALRGQTVVRLKGGDPFVFGRGGEEAEALAAAGIDWEVVPGISAGIAAPAYAGIPLTHRGYASSVAFVTGHGAAGEGDPIDWRTLAHSVDTLVVFMGGRTVGSIGRELLDAELSPETPCALIHRGTCEDQEVFAGTLSELAHLEGGVSLDGPVLAVIGDVVSLRARLRWFGDRRDEQTLADARHQTPSEEVIYDRDVQSVRFAVR